MLHCVLQSLNPKKTYKCWQKYTCTCIHWGRQTLITQCTFALCKETFNTLLLAHREVAGLQIHLTLQNAHNLFFPLRLVRYNKPGTKDCQYYKFCQTTKFTSTSRFGHIQQTKCSIMNKCPTINASYYKPGYMQSSIHTIQNSADGFSVPLSKRAFIHPLRVLIWYSFIPHPTPQPAPLAITISKRIIGHRAWSVKSTLFIVQPSLLWRSKWISIRERCNI